MKIHFSVWTLEGVLRALKREREREKERENERETETETERQRERERERQREVTEREMRFKKILKYLRFLPQYRSLEKVVLPLLGWQPLINELLPNLFLFILFRLGHVDRAM